MIKGEVGHQELTQVIVENTGVSFMMH